MGEQNKHVLLNVNKDMSQCIVTDALSNIVHFEFLLPSLQEHFH